LCALAHTVHAAIIGRANVKIITRQSDGLVDATEDRIAEVQRAYVPIVTVQRLNTMEALAINANVVQRAHVAVVAGGTVQRRRHTSHHRVAIPIQTGILFEAVNRQKPSHTLSLNTLVSSGAGVSVIARMRVVIVRTSERLITNVVGARIAIVTFNCELIGANTSHTFVTVGATIEVAALCIGNGNMFTAYRWRTILHSACVFILADQFVRSLLAYAAEALVPHRARVAIITRI
jgi:hypothetical protein